MLGFCSNLNQARLLAQSLSVQSYRQFDLQIVLVTGEPQRSLEQLQKLFSSYSISGSALCTEESEFSGELLSEVLERATGDYLFLLPPAMFFHPQALFAHLKAIIEHDPALIYSNEVELAGNLQRTVQYYRKSAGDSFGLLARNTFGGGICLKREVLLESIRRINRPICADDLIWLSAAEASRRELNIHFIRLGLICRNSDERVQEPAQDLRSSLFDSLKEYAAALGIEVEKFEQQDSSCLRPRIKRVRSKVQVVIPFRDKPELMDGCLRSLSMQTVAEDLEITLVDNESNQHTLYEVHSQIKRHRNLRISVVPAVGYFNYAWLNNVGAAQSSAPYILLLNNDVELISSETISELLAWAAVPKVGVVGGQLFYPDGDVQCAGINFSPARPAAVHTDNMFMDVVREVNAVTFAMALIRRSVFEELGGLDEFRCPNGFGDALFCQSVTAAGYRTLYTPYATAIHLESRSRDLIPEELELVELFEQGVPISDLFSDFEASKQPTRVVFDRLQEPPVVRLAGRVAANPKVGSVANSVAERLINMNRMRRIVQTSINGRRSR